jgi:hypothetical protein
MSIRKRLSFNELSKSTPFRQAGSGVDPDFIPLPDNHQISWLVLGFPDFIGHNMMKPLKIALRQFLQGSDRFLGIPMQNGA